MIALIEPLAVVAVAGVVTVLVSYAAERVVRVLASAALEDAVLVPLLVTALQ